MPKSGGVGLRAWRKAAPRNNSVCDCEGTWAPLLPALCVLLQDRCLPLLDALLQCSLFALPLLLALLAKQLGGHALQGEDAHSLHAQTDLAVS